jgi:hypothetical protein
MEELTKTLLSVFSGGLAGSVLTLTAQAFARWCNRPRLVLVQYEHRPQCIGWQPMFRLA